MITASIETKGGRGLHGSKGDHGRIAPEGRNDHEEPTGFRGQDGSNGGLRSAIAAALPKLDQVMATSIASHPGRCCQVAREWFLAQSRAHHAVSGLPAPWLRQRWSWGPHYHPLHWCEIVEMQAIDCSALAALTCAGLRAVGAAAATVQMIEYFDPSAVESWAQSWRAHGGDYWLSGATSYHVGVAVRGKGTRNIRIWNPTSECFSEQRPLSGYGSLGAVRVLVDDDCGFTPGERLEWRGRHLRANDWTVLAV